MVKGEWQREHSTLSPDSLRVTNRNALNVERIPVAGRCDQNRCRAVPRLGGVASRVSASISSFLFIVLPILGPEKLEIQARDGAAS